MIFLYIQAGLPDGLCRMVTACKVGMRG